MRKMLLFTTPSFPKYFSQKLSAIGVCYFIVVFSSVADVQKFHLTIKNHVFTPAELVIPANQKVKLIINNNDDVAEEFDSFDLNREKVIFPNKKAVIYVGPLPAGEYEYFGEFHPNSARGKIIVKENSHAN